MAFDLTKPSMTGATLAGEFGNIRENFRAIVQGDASVFTKVRVDIAGTTTPGAFPVQLNNTHATAGDIWGIEFTSTAVNGTSVVSGLLESGGTTAALVFLTGGATPTERMRIDGSGKVGIGASPTYNFEVSKVGTSTSGFGSIIARIWDGTDRGLLFGDAGSASTGVIGAASAGAASTLIFATFSGSVWAERMRITGGGLVGIGRTPSANPLEVAGTIQVVGSAATNTNAFLGTGSTTGNLYGALNNTSGSLLWGVESSVGGTLFTSAGAYASVVGSNTNTNLCLAANGAVKLTILPTGTLLMGTGALTTTATDGFFYTVSCAGAPTGVPTGFTGRVPMIYDTTNNKLWVYNGAWKGVVLT